MAIVTMLSDFGERDGYVAAMKGVVLSLAPSAVVVDAGHAVPRGDVEAAAFVIFQYSSLFPAGTVHLAVVDPGVGGDRRALSLEVDGRFVVAPDNGLVSRVLRAAASWRGVQISDPDVFRSPTSSTFHGRDIFAPAAGHLAGGGSLADLGPPLADPVLLDRVDPHREDGAVYGRVVHTDRFGNLISDIPADWVDGRYRFRVEGRDVGPLRASYSDVPSGQPVVLIGSLGTVEVAVRDGSATASLGVERGAAVLGTR